MVGVFGFGAGFEGDGEGLEVVEGEGCGVSFDLVGDRGEGCEVAGFLGFEEFGDVVAPARDVAGDHLGSNLRFNGHGLS